ncbi:unnamed protein product (macronuclear) [Paramecium tetraurelia]|uniref:ETS domain-containing protein n=1 Tax=Paramecium tetraurelia TaxID=5888 RepID=A0DWD9_PARTE|nr:uncharacterized protein GSPATT00020998001 [Paramecium tetraurelia]CAK87356.1 unnamed protein product [Paramecium tetraurelia]|eukprot:XP_001454753.1 hypothetical protein (macronuclear) [Paramecium tetraurelia strain d4-2]
MSESIKRNAKSFTPYIAKPSDIPSVEASIDPLRQFRPLMRVQTSTDPQVQQMSTDQPFQTNLFYNPPFTSFDISQRVSLDGTNDYLLNHSKIVGPLVNSSLDSKSMQKQHEVLQSQSRFFASMMPIFYNSPMQSCYPYLHQQCQNDLPRHSNNSLDKQVKINKINMTQPYIVNPSSLQQPQQVQSQMHFNTEDKWLGDVSSCQSLFVKKEEDDQSKPKETRNEQKLAKRIRKRIPVEESSDSFRVNRKKKGPKVNDTKNITKNFSKAIISYIINEKELIQKFMTNEQYDGFITLLKNKKNQMTNIKQLRDLWVDTGRNPEFNKVFRIISQYFLKCQAVPYVYNSRISNTAWHLKYRYNLLRAVREPENFKFIKDI